MFVVEKRPEDDVLSASTIGSNVVMHHHPSNSNYWQNLQGRIVHNWSGLCLWPLQMQRKSLVILQTPSVVNGSWTVWKSLTGEGRKTYVIFGIRFSDDPEKYYFLRGRKHTLCLQKGRNIETGIAVSRSCVFRYKYSTLANKFVLQHEKTGKFPSRGNSMQVKLVEEEEFADDWRIR